MKEDLLSSLKTTSVNLFLNNLFNLFLYFVFVYERQRARNNSALVEVRGAHLLPPGVPGIGLSSGLAASAFAF